MAAEAHVVGRRGGIAMTDGLKTAVGDAQWEIHGKAGLPQPEFAEVGKDDSSDAGLCGAPWPFMTRFMAARNHFITRR